MTKIMHQLQHIMEKLDHLLCLGERIMSKVKDFVEAQNAFNDRMDMAVSDLQDDIQNLNDQIKALQESPGEINAEDQELLDGLQVRAKAISSKLDALNALTPPVAPSV